MCNVQHYSVPYDEVVRPIICQHWHLTHLWKELFAAASFQ
jgi:hypothetical protein